jgi:hypothetical protein
MPTHWLFVSKFRFASNRKVDGSVLARFHPDIRLLCASGEVYPDDAMRSSLARKKSSRDKTTMHTISLASARYRPITHDEEAVVDENQRRKKSQ